MRTKKKTTRMKMGEVNFMLTAVRLNKLDGGCGSAGVRSLAR